MRALRLEPARITAEAVTGLVLTHDVSARLRKGTVLGPQHAADLRAAAGEVHAVELEPGDVHEDAAAARLARSLAGEGVAAGPIVLSQARLLAARRGLLRVDAGRVRDLNRLPAVSVFTLFDGQAVADGDEVAGCKVTPVAIAGAVLEAAEALGSALEVVPFKPLRTAVVVTEKLRPKARQAFADAVRVKLGWYGAHVLAVREVARTGLSVRTAYQEAMGLGAQLVLFAGASSIDPLDSAYTELIAAGGEVVRMGAPAHPGSMLWLGRLAGVPVLGVASCAGFGRATALDLLLPFVFAYGRADADDLARLGHGGLVEETAGRRFPPYSR